MIFTLEIAIHMDRLPADQREALFAAHRAWLQTQYDRGVFLLMGPYLSKTTTGLILLEAADQASVETLIEGDAFYPHYADYQIHTIQVNRVHPTISTITDRKEEK